MDKNNDMKKKVFNDYANMITEVFCVSKESLFNKTKQRNIVYARYMLHYLCYKRPMDITTIMGCMSDNGYPMSYSNIQYGIAAMKKKLRKDKDLSDAYKRIRTIYLF
jgi:chromosomal replication initiation ATPase DnaA